MVMRASGLVRSAIVTGGVVSDDDGCDGHE